MTFGFGRESASSRWGGSICHDDESRRQSKNKITGNGRPAANVGYYPFSKRVETALFLKLRRVEKKKTFATSFHLNRCIDNQKEGRGEGGSRPSNGRGAGIIDRLAETFIIIGELSVSASLLLFAAARNPLTRLPLSAGRSQSITPLAVASSPTCSLSCWLKLFYKSLFL